MKNIEVEAECAKLENEVNFLKRKKLVNFKIFDINYFIEINLSQNQRVHNELSN